MLHGLGGLKVLFWFWQQLRWIWNQNEDIDQGRFLDFSILCVRHGCLWKRVGLRLWKVLERRFLTFSLHTSFPTVCHQLDAQPPAARVASGLLQTWATPGGNLIPTGLVILPLWKVFGSFLRSWVWKMSARLALNLWRLGSIIWSKQALWQGESQIWSEDHFLKSVMILAWTVLRWEEPTHFISKSTEAYLCFPSL